MSYPDRYRHQWAYQGIWEQSQCSKYENGRKTCPIQLLGTLIFMKKITQSDKALSIQQQHSNVGFMTATMFTLEENVKKNFKNILFQEIKKLFQAKAAIA